MDCEGVEAEVVFNVGASLKSIRSRLEIGLRNLRSDYVDGLFAHSADTREILRNEEIRAAYSQFKKEGLVRFTGFSTHNEKETLPECLKPEYDDFVDAVMFRYNHLESKNIEPYVKQMHEKYFETKDPLNLNTYMGIGHFIMPFNGYNVVSHSGGNIGWSTQMLFIPETGDGLVVLTNGQYGTRLTIKLTGRWIRYIEKNLSFR